jgi:nicotinamidase-related amidase
MGYLTRNIKNIKVCEPQAKIMSSKINASRTALLLLDLQNIHIERTNDSDGLLSRSAATADTARKHGITVIHCRVAFTAEESANLPPAFARLKHNPTYLAAMHVDALTSQFHPDIAPQDGDLVIVKKRVGPFRNAPQNFDAILRERGIDTLIVGGIATGGAVLSTIVEATDLDYRLFLLEDACADSSPATHEFLVDFLKKRADVIKCAELEALIEQ